MKFAHLADCHIGAWRDPKLRDANLKAFSKAIDVCIDKGVDFIVIAGDLFNTSLPSIDGLKTVVKRFKELKDKGINVYGVAGSHDFSPSGKTMLDVLEKAGLFVNVAKGEVVDGKLKLRFAIDKKTGAKITGLLGKKGSLERGYYEQLVRDNLEKEEGYKIFLFHSALTEFKPKELEKIDSHPLSLLPKNFNYYAGGHPHYIFDKKEEGYGIIAYPGPLFPNNFKEIEDLERGGFYIVEDDKLEWQPIQIYNAHKLTVDCNHKTPEQIKEEILSNIKGKEFYNTIVTIRLKGNLESGKVSDIGFKEIFSLLYDKSAYFVMKSAFLLKTKEFEEIKVDVDSIEEIEESLIKEHIGQIKVKDLTADKEAELTKKLMNALSIDKKEGEKVTDFEARIKSEVDKILGS
ncbi:DNA repair exonuclease [Candidatus Woesearchaeota archaeon]|nr:DNA repair exonuclease [Candidatus Woesearchaeota archaeon]